MMGWMSGQSTNGHMNGWIYGQTGADGRRDGCTDGCINGWICEYTNEQADGCTDVRIEYKRFMNGWIWTDRCGWMKVSMYRRMHERMDIRIYGRTDGWMYR